MDYNSLDLIEGNQTVRVSEGIFYFRHVPEYYIIHVEGYGEEYVLVYGIQDKKSENPTRAFKRVPINKTDQILPGGTPLSDLIRSKVGVQTEYKLVYDDPLFIAIIVHGKQDTITGKIGKGFYERTPEITRYTNKENKLEGGKYTGVFITLENIDWIKSYVPLDSVISEYQRMKEDRLNV